MTTRRTHYHGTVDSNGYPYCTECGMALCAHRDNGKALLCPCSHPDVSRSTFEHRFYRCNVCGADLYD